MPLPQRSLCGFHLRAAITAASAASLPQRSLCGLHHLEPEWNRSIEYFASA